MRKLLILLCMVLLLTGCTGKVPEQTVPPTTVPETTLLPEPETTLPAQTEADPEEAALAMYDWVLELYRDALAEKWDPQQCIDKEISYMTAMAEELTYALADLDGNGNLELLIRCGDTILDAYTLTDCGPGLMFTGWERNSYRLVQKADDSGYYILNYGANGAANSLVNVYRWNGRSLELVEALEFNALENEEEPWFRREGENLIPITREEYNSIGTVYQLCQLNDHALAGRS
ncbi:MAG: hypothetical protein ACI3WQ_01460 [Faecousia sp.]